MKVQLIKTKEFYPTMQKWWDGQNFPHVTPSMLPENTFVVYNDEGNPTHSMCFYNTDSNLCWLGFPVSDVEVSNKTNCFNFLIKMIEKYAKQQGYQIMFTTTEHDKVKHTLNKNNYIVGDTNVDHYLKFI